MLLVTPGRSLAVDNIRKAASEGRFNDKTEPFDPVWDPSELKENILGYVRKRHTPWAKLKKALARTIVDSWVKKWSEGVNEIIGLEKLSAIKGPAFLTCNHFNPFDNGVIRTASRLSGHGRLWAISQGTNFVMPGLNGFVLRNIDVIPLIPEPSYMNGEFRIIMKEVLDNGSLILVYPEQEMWFNYRKPRPGKRGAFLFAAQYGVPVVPCFMQMDDLGGGPGNVKLTLHILDPICPDPRKNVRDNSIQMCKMDYDARVKAYESAYGKPLDYAFGADDIAGFTSKERS